VILAASRQVNDTAEQQKQTQLQKAVVTERLAGLHARQEHLRAALEQAVAAAAAAAVEPSVTADKLSAADSYAAAAQRKAAAKAAAAVLVEDDAFDAELNVGKGSRRGAAAATGFVETERDRLIRTVCRLRCCAGKRGLDLLKIAAQPLSACDTLLRHLV